MHSGASWRVRITPPPPPDSKAATNQQLVSLPPIGLGQRPSKAANTRMAIKSSILQTSAVDTSNSGRSNHSDAAGEDDKPKVRLTLWRADGLMGTVELDAGLKVRRADTVAGLVMGRPSAYLLKHSLHK